MQWYGRAAKRKRSNRKCRSRPVLHAACDCPVIVWTQSVWTCWKNDQSGNGNGLELSERREKTPLLSITTQQKQTRHVLVGTINFHLMLVAIRNMVELVRSRRRLGGVSYTPVEGPISFHGRREREGSWWSKKWMCVSCCAAIEKTPLLSITTQQKQWVLYKAVYCALLWDVITTASGVISVANWPSRVVLFEPLPSQRGISRAPIETVIV